MIKCYVSAIAYQPTTLKKQFSVSSMEKNWLLSISNGVLLQLGLQKTPAWCYTAVNTKES